jgi:hypothetical protein
MKHLPLFTIGLIIGIIMTAIFAQASLSYWKNRATQCTEALNDFTQRVDKIYDRYLRGGYWIYYYRPEISEPDSCTILDSLWIDLPEKIIYK